MFLGKPVAVPVASRHIQYCVGSQSHGAAQQVYVPWSTCKTVGLGVGTQGVHSEHLNMFQATSLVHTIVKQFSCHSPLCTQGLRFANNILNL